ncbi:MAG TPA: hypothetical protein VLY87_03790, partial [Flavobacterium sp.]|nr:hypothetical protein [Flavobacterium sp.]
MNKKLHLVLVGVLGMFVGSNVNAQTVLSQTGGIAPNDSSVYCPMQNPAGQQKSSFFRAYTLTSNMDITTMRIGVGGVVLGTGVNGFPLTVKLHKSNGAFP